MKQNVVTLRLPDAIATRVFESTPVADAGFRVHAPHYPKGMPKDTGWTSFRVECPKAFDAPTLVKALRGLA